MLAHAGYRRQAGSNADKQKLIRGREPRHGANNFERGKGTKFFLLRSCIWFCPRGPDTLRFSNPRRTLGAYRREQCDRAQQEGEWTQQPLLALTNSG
jgi:hypothetical protein